MKVFLKIICISFLLLLYNFQNSFSQSWQPLTNSWKYNYKLDSSAFITKTIWIDSAEVINGDSVFYLNRIVTHCDTCTAALGGPNPCDSCYALKNQPQFLQRKVEELPNGILYFNDTSKIILNSLAALNDNWLFDSINNISAQIIAVATDSVFGNIDSIKTILLSSGDTIKLSMNYGILQYPNLYGQNSYYHLAGIEGPNLGEQVPGFWEFFDFNVGDVFHYSGTRTDLAVWPNGSVIYYQRQITITNKTQLLDTVIYDVVGNEWGYDIVPSPWVYFNDTINWSIYAVDSLSDFTNSYNHQLTYVARSFITTSMPFTQYPDSVLDYSLFTIDSNGIFSKGFADENAYYINYWLIDPVQSILNSIDIGNTAWLGTASLKYKVGLGQTDYSYFSFEHGAEEHLVGYIKNGIPFGIIASVSFIESQNQFSIYPNPAKDKINIQFANINSSKIFITDNAGRKILEKRFNDKEIELNVSTLASGLYFLTVQNKDGVFNRKIIITRE